MLSQQQSLPVGVDRTSREPISLEQALAAPERLAPIAEMTLAERSAMVRARWAAGEWTDLDVCGESVDADRAVRELEARTPLGMLLLELGEGAVEMVLEDAR
ncbi:MAG: hypothetical protein WC558_09400 [Patulibacter sp.]